MMANQQENFLNPEDLNRRIEEVEAALARVSSSIQQLEEEAHLAKSDISQSFEKHLVELHNRHVQLLRQVDVLYRERKSSLHNQVAQCNRLLGTLKTTQQYADYLYKNRNYIQIQGIAGVKSFGSAGHFNVKLDDDSLSLAITGFGKVDMDGFLVLPSEETSKCLPARVEEYQDDESIVLNKPLHKEGGTIEVRFPQLPKDYSFWLSHKSQAAEVPKDSTPVVHRRTADDFKPCDVQTWLAHIQQETAGEPLEADFVSSSSSSASESIEVVSAMDCTEKVPAATCCHQPMLNVEIENLAETFGPCLIDKQKWLNPKSKSHTDISVATACKANETCSSFDDCLCETSCHDQVVKKREDKERQTLRAKWLRDPNSRTITSSPFQMPQQYKSESSFWLRPQSGAAAEPQTIASIFPVMDKADWLRPLAPPSATTNGTTAIPLVPEPHLWLRTKDEANQQLKQQSGFSDWLLKRGGVTEKSWLRPQHPETTTPLLQALKEMKQMRISEEEAWNKWLLRRF